MQKLKFLIQATTALYYKGRQPDPFLDTNCDCARFCAYECAIFPEQKQNLTVYRMTMDGVYNLDNKNTGDVGGDMSFVLNKQGGEGEESKYHKVVEMAETHAKF